MLSRISAWGSTSLKRNSTILCRQVPRTFATAAEEETSTALPKVYTKTVSVLHWLTAPTLMGAIGSVMYAQSLPKEDKEDYRKWMWRHKSLGLLTGLLVVPRVANRVMLQLKPKSLPPSLSGPFGSMQEDISVVSHAALYGFMVFMPVTGVAMGYYGGYGLPFFWTTINGASKENINKGLAGKAYHMHAAVGYYGKFLIPLHVAGAGAHAAKGQSIFARINPFNRGSVAKAASDKSAAATAATAAAAK